MKNIILLVLIIFYIPYGTPALAADTWRTKENASLLPRYCQDIVANRWPGNWRRVLGDVSAHMHHYCSGIYAEMKAKGALGKRERRNWLEKVIGEMRYVSRDSEPNSCALYPELHTRWGWALVEQGYAGEALQHLRMAIEVKPEYILAYVRLSELYLKIDQPEEAMKILESGLEVRPGSRTLERRIRELNENKSSRK